MQLAVARGETVAVLGPAIEGKGGQVLASGLQGEGSGSAAVHRVSSMGLPKAA